jgi:sarcosine oxidase subunit alpha
MGELTELDCSAEAFTYLDGKPADLAGVPCLTLRSRFVGAVGYAIHYPSAHGARLGDALMEAGRKHGLRPFGLEPRRLLRLQTMHILIGQDTDSESTPFGAAMPWIVKLDKDQEFIGKWALERVVAEVRVVAFWVVVSIMRPA